jgi:hypothetical protein
MIATPLRLSRRQSPSEVTPQPTIASLVPAAHAARSDAPTTCVGALAEGRRSTAA